MVDGGAAKKLCSGWPGVLAEFARYAGAGVNWLIR